MTARLSNEIAWMAVVLPVVGGGSQLLRMCELVNCTTSFIYCGYKHYPGGGRCT